MPPLEQIMRILLPILTAVISAVVFFFIGVGFRKRVAEREIGSAEEEATRILNDAIKSAEAKKREAMVEAKEEILRNRNEAEREIKEQRQDLSKHEKRIQQKEETLDRKIDNAEKKEETLDRKIKEADEVRKKLEEQKLAQQEALEKISGFTTEEAKNYLLKSLEDDLQHESALKIKEMEAQVRDTSDRKAREIISYAISKCAADYVADATVSVVNLPNDEMKGRIIGREGRNIRAIETITGVDLIIDDTPEAITLSCFDPVRREIARNALEKLIADGRIHPARIEEMVEKSRREVEQLIKQDGEKACFETSVHGLHPELVKILGRLRYRTSYGQNVLKHSIEVAHIAGYLASEVGADPVMARRAGLLHDIGKALDRDMEGSHVQIGVDIAKKYKENFEVVHAIHAHHGDVEPQTVIACLVDAADDLSAARPGARRENLDAYIKRLEKLEEIANSFEGVDRSFAIQAGREVRIIVKPEKISDDQLTILARDLSKKIESELEYPGQIKINCIRETRATDFAK